MHRITTADRSADKHGTGKDGFTDGDPATGALPTKPDAAIMDSLQEEVANAVEVGAAAALDSTVFTQLAGLVLRNALVPSFTSPSPGSSYTGTWGGAAHGAPIGVDLYLLVGTGDEIQTSPRGTTWTKRTPGVTASVAYKAALASTVAGLFVIAGSSGEIETSADGITWTRRNNAGDGFNALAESGSIVVAAGDNGRLVSSVDGITWTERTADSYSGNFVGLVWNGAVFCALGSDGEVQTSSDGITWTAQTTIGGGDGDSIAANPDTGRIIATRAADLTIYTSDDDGASFASDATALYDVGSDTAKRIFWRPGLWLVSTASRYLQTSVDEGATWFLHAQLSFSTSIGPAVWGAGPTGRLVCGSGSADGQIRASRRA